jgi:lysophospholipase L1-like esterase
MDEEAAAAGLTGGLSFLMRSSIWKLLRLAACLVSAVALSSRAEQCLVLGDSLTKEYEITFPVLYPQNPGAWDARNWIEILHERRNAWFDTGRMSAYADPRIIGHKHNWAFAGASVSMIRSQLSKTGNVWWTGELKRQLRSEVERVVIFAGGNDVDRYYGYLYNGRPASTYINATRDHLRWLVDYVRGVRPSLPIALVSVPHLGCTPDIQRVHPYDPVKTGRVTTALDSLNGQLASFARLRGIAFVPGVYQMTKAMLSQPLRIGDVTFINRPDAEARPQFVFSGDGFHPNTCAHARIAQMVVEAFRVRYPSRNMTSLGDQELLTEVLGLR